MVDVVGAQDVVLAEIAADLDLDDLDRHFPRILQAVPLRREDVDALVFADEFLDVADHDFRGALHNDPVLGAVMVHLHGQLAAGLDVQELHLEPRADVQRFEKAPGPVVAEMLLLLFPVQQLELGDDLRHLLRSRLVGD